MKFCRQDPDLSRLSLSVTLSEKCVTEDDRMSNSELL